MIQSVAVPFLVLILYFKFTQSSLVFINKILFFLNLSKLAEILNVLTESFFAEVFSLKHFVINVYYVLS